jgi:hypothetical protein
MSAIPVISAGVSAVSAISGIQRQNAAANAQASALDDERTNAIVQAKITSGEQTQQQLIAQTQAEIQREQTAVNFRLAANQALLQREQYNATVETQRAAIEQARLQAAESVDTNAAQIEQQKLVQQSQLLQQQNEAKQSISNAQNELQATPDGQDDLITQLAMAARSNRFTGTSNEKISASLKQQANRANASIAQLNLDSAAVDTATATNLGLADQVANAALDVNAANSTINEQALNSADATIDQNVDVADRTLSEFQQALQNAINSNASSEVLQQLLMDETVKAQQRAAELNLSASVTSINNQAANIQRPGIADVLGAGVSIYNTYGAMQEMQAQIAANNQRIEATKSNANFLTQPANPFFGTQDKGYQGNGLNTGINQSSIMADYQAMVKFQADQDSRINNSVFQTGGVEFVNPYVPVPDPAPKPSIQKAAIKKK